MDSEFATDTPNDDRWLFAWAVGYAAVGGASVLLPLYALSLNAGAFYVGLMSSTAAVSGTRSAAPSRRRPTRW